MSSHGDAENAEFEPGRAPLVAEPSVPRPDPRSCCMWFLPVGSMLIPPRMLPGEAGSTPRTLTRPEQTTTSRDPRIRREGSAAPGNPLRLETSASPRLRVSPLTPRLRVSPTKARPHPKARRGRGGPPPRPPTSGPVPLRARPARRPLGGHARATLAGALRGDPRRRQDPPLARHALRVLRGEVRQHRGQRRVVPDLLEHDLVVRVPVRVPRDRPVAPGQRAQVEGRRARADEGRVVAAAAARRARDLELDVPRDLDRHARQPLPEVDARID